ncbi:MAG: asparagine synthase (glutamine-hydrolyzing) [Planctomycetes bacterium]|nr:asparagine synthase (glutamine-hydrolyzing) [Planctomycetota bacterium]
MLEPMCQAMAHRGPDDAGTWHDASAQVGLGHRRLSIIDVSSAGHQPMCSADETVWISYNGEIYNFRELRSELEDKGYRFKSQSDTEVLVYLYQDLGERLLEKLNGIFALAIWDTRKRQLLLARDHAGIKPLYYWQEGGRLFFASEIKALLRLPDVPRQLNRQAVPDYLTFLWVPGDRTMLAAIRKIEPGHALTWRDGQVSIRPWFSLAYVPDESVAEEEWVQRVHDTFLRCTQRQMVSDVPLGAFLSGGLDSSSIVAGMRLAYPNRRIKCYTIRFNAGDMVRDQFVEDYPYARRVADHLDLTLESIVLDPSCISLLPKMIYHLDEPDADPAVFPSYLISKLAREDGTTVLLSGTGGDEVFFGYRSHVAYRQYDRLRYVPRWLLTPLLSLAERVCAAAGGAQSARARRLRRFNSGLRQQGLERHVAMSDWSSPATRAALYSPELLDDLAGHDPIPDCMRRYYDGFVGTGNLNRRSHVLIQTFLAAHNFLYTDKSSMAASIEARVPFMDLELMRLCARIPERFKLRGGVTKYLLKKAMEPYLPQEVIYRSKTGFGAPLRKWIAEDLDPVIHELLSTERLKARGLFEPATVQRILDENRANRADHAYLIYALLGLEIWQQTFIDRAGVEVTF